MKRSKAQQEIFEVIRKAFSGYKYMSEIHDDHISDTANFAADDVLDKIEELGFLKPKRTPQEGYLEYLGRDDDGSIKVKDVRDGSEYDLQIFEDIVEPSNLYREHIWEEE